MYLEYCIQNTANFTIFNKKKLKYLKEKNGRKLISIIALEVENKIL